jgi:hypothetical protein
VDEAAVLASDLRRVFNLVAALSLLLAITVAVLWVISYRRFARTSSTSVGASDARA